MSRSTHRLIEREYVARLEFVTTLLGSQPTHSIAVEHVRAKQVEQLTRELVRAGTALAEAEAIAVARVEETLPMPDGESPLRHTGFPADERGLFLWDYQIRQMIKSVAQTLGLKVRGKRAAEASAVSDIQKLLWVYDDMPIRDGRDAFAPKKLRLRRDGRPIPTPDRMMERPLRAQTMQGPRVSIAVSEALDPPVELAFRIGLVRGCRITEEHLHDILSYGALEGLGQWRSGGWGRFTYDLREVR